MILPFLLFWLLIGWGLYDGDIYPKEAGVCVTVWIGLLLCFLFLKVSPFWFVVPTVLLDIYLILKVFGQDIQIR
jgi:hypothetical protein